MNTKRKEHKIIKDIIVETTGFKRREITSVRINFQTDIETNVIFEILDDIEYVQRRITIETSQIRRRLNLELLLNNK